MTTKQIQKALKAIQEDVTVNGWHPADAASELLISYFPTDEDSLWRLIDATERRRDLHDDTRQTLVTWARGIMEYGYTN